MTKGPHRPIRSFGRTGGRPLSARQQALIDDMLPTLAIPSQAPASLDPNTLFQNEMREIWLEIGFGGGEHLIHQAARHPDVGFIGCEPFIEGMAKALVGIESHRIENVRLHMDDARDLIDWLTPSSIARVFILFPDPWPKKKQRKRRLVQPEFLHALRRVCRDDAELRLATDVASYADEALLHLTRHPGFDWTAERAADWRSAPEDHCKTRYETKRLGDCEPVWLEMRAAQAPTPCSIQS